jgi:SAM-dependent methyltransferase
MVSVDDIVRFGISSGLNENCRVLDLCCGYGTMLKIWREVFNVNGVGVDRDATFIETGRKRLSNDGITLICGDVLQYTHNEKYDVVVCTELSTGLFDSFGEGIAFLERFLKPSGTLVFGRLFSEIPNPPQELIEFDGSLPTLHEIYKEVRQYGYLITSMASGNTASWERYIMRDSKNSLDKSRKNPDDANWSEWTDKWYRIYYDFRRPYEGWALFGIEKL